MGSAVLKQNYKKEKKMKINYKELADLLLDHFCVGWSVREAIGFLYSRGYTKEQLLDLDFSEEDIDEVINCEGEENE
jgi:hypothetical protein